ncbi:MAG: thymidylate kinase [Clostridiaceae bacterium]|nr:thymidylate kinase [Clostridiaceae bacterium]
MSKFIVLEGTDGSGKSTQLALTCKRLDDTGILYKRLTFPRYDNQSSALLKMYLNGDFGTDPESVNPYAASTFFSVDRYASFKTDWQQAYEAGIAIIADRYTTSNAIHQASKLNGEAREAFLKWLFDFEYRLLGLPSPDRVIFLDMPSQYALTLLEKRQGNSGDIHEKDHEYLEKCREGALDIGRRYGWQTISCAGERGLKTPEEINDEVYKAVCEVFLVE